MTHRIGAAVAALAIGACTLLGGCYHSTGYGYHTPVYRGGTQHVVVHHYHHVCKRTMFGGRTCS